MFWILMPLVGLLLLLSKKVRDLVVGKLRIASQGALGAFVAIGFIGFLLTGCSEFSDGMPALVIATAAVLFWVGIFSAFESARRSTTTNPSTTSSTAFQATRIEKKPVKRTYSKVFPGDDDWKLETKDLPSFVRIAGELAKSRRQVLPTNKEDDIDKEIDVAQDPVVAEAQAPDHIQARDSLVQPWAPSPTTIFPALGLRDELSQESPGVLEAEAESVKPVAEEPMAEMEDVSVSDIDIQQSEPLEEGASETAPGTGSEPDPGADPVNTVLPNSLAEKAGVDGVPRVHSIFGSTAKQQEPADELPAGKLPAEEAEAAEKQPSKYVYKPTMVKSKFGGDNK